MGGMGGAAVSGIAASPSCGCAAWRMPSASQAAGSALPPIAAAAAPAAVARGIEAAVEAAAGAIGGCDGAPPPRVPNGSGAGALALRPNWRLGLEPSAPGASLCRFSGTDAARSWPENCTPGPQSKLLKSAGRFRLRWRGQVSQGF